MDDPEHVIIAAYKLAGDSHFVEYWEVKEREIDDIEGPLANANWETLLAKGILVWCLPSSTATMTTSLKLRQCLALALQRILRSYNGQKLWTGLYILHISV